MGKDLPLEQRDLHTDSWETRPGPTRGHVSPPALGSRTRLIGRERMLADIVHLLRLGEVPLLNLVGPGGVGKTRLAVAAVQELSDHFDDGIVFLPLETIRDPQLVLPTIAAAFGVGES